MQVSSLKADADLRHARDLHAQHQDGFLNLYKLPRKAPLFSLLQAFQGASTESLCSDKLAEACEDDLDVMSFSWHGSDCIDTDTDDDMLVFAAPADDAEGIEPAPAHCLQAQSQQALPGAPHLLC